MFGEDSDSVGWERTPCRDSCVWWSGIQGMFKREIFHGAFYVRLVKVSEQGLEFELSWCQRE